MAVAQGNSNATSRPIAQAASALAMGALIPASAVGGETPSVKDRLACVRTAIAAQSGVASGTGAGQGDAGTDSDSGAIRSFYNFGKKFDNCY